MIRRPPRSTLFPSRRSSDLKVAIEHGLALASTLPTEALRVAESGIRSEEHTSELQSPCNLVCRLLLEKKKQHTKNTLHTRQAQQTHTSKQEYEPAHALATVN